MFQQPSAGGDKVPIPELVNSLVLIWVRDHRDGGWIEATWTHLHTGPVPFGDLAWEQAQRMLARRGINDPTEAEIAQAASDLAEYRSERAHVAA